MTQKFTTAGERPSFTPGPWRYSNRNDGHFRVYSPQGMGAATGPVCEVLSQPLGVEIRRANARLIAAAPDLYEALKAIMGGDEAIQVSIGGNTHHVGAVMARAFAALAKAEGRAG